MSLTIPRTALLVVVCQLLFCALSSAAFGINASQLADICQAMETGISDISIKYELYNDPPQTADDIGGSAAFISKGPTRFHLISKRPFNEYRLLTVSTMVADGAGRHISMARTTSYKGNICKQLEELAESPDGNTPAKRMSPSGNISRDRPQEYPIELTPLGFSVLRLAYGSSTKPLSEYLRRGDYTRISNDVERINDCNTIRADFLGDTKKLPVLRAYFSVDHGYTPVRYEYMSGSKVVFTVDVTSLEKVANGIWFPISGKVDQTVYRATAPILMNQGPKDEVFDIKFPPGTTVFDKITGKRYTIKPTQEQLDETLPTK
jgi:outer membrane lipoprotein-sorting protein